MRYWSKLLSDGSSRMRSIAEAQWGVLSGTVHLVASVCYPFPSVLSALAEPSCLLPAEGMPGVRYLPGAAVMDNVEREAEQLLLEMFGRPDGYRATIQPHSGTQANQIVFNAALRADDLVLCLAPVNGGHISHSVLIGRRNPVKYYDLGPDNRIDFDRLHTLAQHERPRLIIAGGSACPRAIDFENLGRIAHEFGAYLHADISHTATFIAAQAHPPVFPHVDFATFNMAKNLRGPNGGVLMYRKDMHPQVSRAIFPDTQGGANENMMLAKLAALDEWTRQDIAAHAASMMHATAVMGQALQAHGLPLVTGGSDSHLLLIDLRDRRLTGAEVEADCEREGVLLNRNLVPGDVRKPWVTSGIRIGTACVSVLGYSDLDLQRLASWIADRVNEVDRASDKLIEELTQRYKIAPEV